METIKSYSSLEQSKVLANILPLESADMCYIQDLLAGCKYGEYKPYGHGDERIFPCEPYRNFPNMNLEVLWGQRWTTGSIDTEYKRGVLLPKGTIKHLIGKEMTYADEPIKIL